MSRLKVLVKDPEDYLGAPHPKLGIGKDQRHVEENSFLSGLSFPCKEDTNGESSQPRPSHRGPALPPQGVSKGWWKSGWWALSWHRAQGEGSGSWPACPKPFPEAFGICKQQ